ADVFVASPIPSGYHPVDDVCRSGSILQACPPPVGRSERCGRLIPQGLLDRGELRLVLGGSASVERGLSLGDRLRVGEHLLPPCPRSRSEPSPAWARRSVHRAAPPWATVQLRRTRTGRAAIRRRP